MQAQRQTANFARLKSAQYCAKNLFLDSAGLLDLFSGEFAYYASLCRNIFGKRGLLIAVPREARHPKPDFLSIETQRDFLPWDDWEIHFHSYRF